MTAHDGAPPWGSARGDAVAVMASALPRTPVAAQPVRRRGASARLRIMGWLVLLLVVPLASVVLVTNNELQSRLDRTVEASLQQEVDEFEQFARRDRDPGTGQPFVTTDQLLQVYLDGQSVDEHEGQAGLVLAAPDAPLGAGRVDTATAALNEPGVLAGIAATADASGTAPTTAGELRWARVRILVGDDLSGYFVVGHLVATERAEVAQAVQTLAVVSLLALLLAAAASWVVAGQILGPVRELHRTAAAITEDDLTRRIPVRGRDDIAALTEQFNAMLDRLQTAFATQRGFLDDVSHELRTPITIVRGNLELMRSEPTEWAEDRRLCLDELDRMSRMVDDLLLLATSERPDFLRVREVEIAELTSDIDAKVRSLGPRRWRLVAMAEGTAILDPQRVTQAVVALAHNAVGHTGDSDTISVGSALDGDRLSFWITDTGPGVAPQDAESIFERFSRGAGGRDRAGAGLGLAIVTAIAAAHDGRARLHSVPGAGATFGIEIPAGPRPAPAPREETTP